MKLHKHDGSNLLQDPKMFTDNLTMDGTIVDNFTKAFIRVYGPLSPTV